MGEGPPTTDPAQTPGLSAQVPPPLIPPLQQPNRLVALIAEITGRPEPEVVERLRNEEANLGRAAQEELDRRGIERYVWSDELVQFYEQTDAFLYESLVWNVTRHKNGMRRWIAEFLLRRFDRPANILMYGDGLGIDSYYLTQAGHRVASFEVSQDCVHFAESIHAMGDMAVRIYRDAAEVPTEGCDVLICLDVLEHVPDPPALVRQLSGWLRPGGYLIVHAPFFYVHPAVCTHLRANRRYSGDIRRLYRPAGLQLIDGRPFWDPVVFWKSSDQAERPPRSLTRRCLLWTTGLLLAVGRYWSSPFCKAAHKLTQAREISLTEGL